MVVQWLRLSTFTAMDPGSILSQETEIPQVVQWGQKKETHLRFKDKEWTRICSVNNSKEGLDCLLGDKLNFKTKIVNNDKVSFYNDKRVNPSRKYNNYKMYMHLTAESQIYKSKLTELKKNTLLRKKYFKPIAKDCILYNTFTWNSQKKQILIDRK